MISTRDGFPLEDTLLHRKIIELTNGIFNCGWRSTLPQGQTRTCSIEYADCFIGQLASGEITVRKMNRCSEPLVQNTDLMMLLQ